ncbi:MAG: hypothetical protein HON27_15600 [Candidatus Marinimicrobia bacterium]|jgi:hypothetical protein|nr:hypothetical protein [Candidatus Neomarinimicrobiota bacterium]
MSRSKKTWDEQAKGLLPAVPGLDYIQRLEIDDAIKNGVASALYRIKSGDSVWLSAPFHSTNDLQQIIQYVHYVRVESLRGILFSNWFNRKMMVSKPDLVVWTRTSFQYPLLRSHSNLGIQRVRFDSQSKGFKDSLKHEDRVFRTLVCKPDHQIIDLCDSLATLTQPFMHIVDLTPFGVRDDISELLAHIDEFFPFTPVLILSTSTDASSDSELFSLLQNTHHQYHPWRQHQQDNHFLGTIPKVNKCTLVELPDSRLENTLISVLELYQSLRESIKNHKEQQEIIQPPLNKVINGLRFLAVPLRYLEQQYSRKRKGGRFPVKPLIEWLEVAESAKLSMGDSDNLRRQIVTQLRRLYRQIDEGKTGRYQSLMHWLEMMVKPDKNSLVITGTELDAKILREWLHSNHSNAFEEGYLSVVGISSARDCYKHLHQHFDHALVISPLYRDNQWVLSIADQVYWIGYPNELHWMQWASIEWIARTQESREGKLDWWLLNPVDHVIPEPQKEPLPIEIWSKCSGEYPVYNSVDVELKDDPQWYLELMKPIKEPVYNTDMKPVRGEVSIRTSSGSIRRYHESEMVYILTGKEGEETLEKKSVIKLEKGDLLIFPKDDESASDNLYETLFTSVIDDSHKWKSIVSLIDMWHNMITKAVFECGGVEALRDELNKKGIKQGIETVRQWSNHQITNPHNKVKVVTAMANITGQKQYIDNVITINNAQSKLSGLRSQVGKMLKRVMLASTAPNTSVKGRLASEIDEDLLRDLIEIDTVVTVAHHPVLTRPSTAKKKTVTGILAKMAEVHSDKLVITSHAMSSAKNCLYKDLDRVQVLMDFLIGPLYKSLGTNLMSVAEAITIAQKLGLRPPCGISDITMGKYKAVYFRTYNGQSINLGWHIGIGNAWDGSRCFRLHYHWDSKEKKIVVHYAGKHLSDQNS